MHDHTQKHTTEIVGSSNRTFGIVFALVFLIIALYPIVGAGLIRFWSLATSGVFLIIALFFPSTLAPTNRLWMKFGMLLQYIVSPIALGILFFLVVTPTGLLMRILGKDPLRLRFVPTSNSYWITRKPPGPNADSLKNQF